MSALLDTLLAELGKAVPMLIAALVGAAVAWINALRDRARVREVIAESAARQALDAHGDSPEADMAAVAELHKIDPRYRPKDAPKAVSAAMERERARSASSAPPAADTWRGGEIDDDERPTIPDADSEPIAVCGKQCSHGSDCLKLAGHEGGHDTQHGCVFYDPEPKP